MFTNLRRRLEFSPSRHSVIVSGAVSWTGKVPADLAARILEVSGSAEKRIKARSFRPCACPGFDSRWAASSCAWRSAPWILRSFAPNTATLAGTYVSDSLGESFEIWPDGRFAWGVWGRRHYYVEEYGYVKRRGDVMELASIPQAGSPTCLPVNAGYRMIRWGDEMYLCSNTAAELDRFCRFALAPRLA